MRPSSVLSRSFILPYCGGFYLFTPLKLVFRRKVDAHPLGRTRRKRERRFSDKKDKLREGENRTSALILKRQNGGGKNGILGLAPSPSGVFNLRCE